MGKKSESFFGAANAKISKATNNLSTKLDSLLSSDWFLKLTFCWFSIQASLFALTTRFGLPPDETYHLTYIKLFSEHSPSPILASQGSYFILLEAVKNPFFLYHYILSFPYLLVSSLPGPYIFLRFINIGLGIVSLYLVYKIANLINVTKLARNLSIFMLSSTLMFVFIFSSISYDNLFIMLSIAGVYLLLSIERSITVTRLLLFSIVIISGMLVKINFLPIAFILLLVFLFQSARKMPTFAKKIKKTFNTNKLMNYGLLLITVLLGLLFLQRYALNVVQYHKFAPDCQQVLDIEYCRQNSLFQRTELFEGKGKRPINQGIMSYSAGWSKLMVQRTFGLFAHKRFPAGKIITIWAIFMFSISTVGFIRLWKPSDRKINILLVISVFYLCVLLLENFSTYTSTGIPQLAIHGRYAFCILPLLFLIGNHYTLRLLRNNLLRSIYLITTIIVFALSCLPVYFQESSVDWYNPSSKTLIVDRLKN